MNHRKKDQHIKTCDYCGSAEESEHKLQACSQCRLVAYCSKACQRAHWKNGHKQACVAVENRKPDYSSFDTLKKKQEAKDTKQTSFV
jgi:hypothetical protein